MFLRFFYRRRLQEERKTLFRNFIFGVEDSLVSTVGMLSGVAAADTPRNTIIASGVILIFVEAFSMGVGSFLSEETSDQLSSKRSLSNGVVRKAALLMFISYFLAGFIPLTPYVIFRNGGAELYSIIASLFSLFLLGVVSAKFFKGKMLYKGFEMLVLGGFATLVGIGVGSLFKL